MLCRMFIKISSKKSKRSLFLLFITLFFCVASLTTTLLIVRSQKLLEADLIMQDYGNYDIAFCQVTQELEQEIKEDSRFSQMGYIYDLGQVSFAETGGSLELGALQDKNTEEMYYVNPKQGRYPEKEGEICIDRITLKGCGYEEKLGQKIRLSCPQQNGMEEREYTLVGIIEVQKQDEGVVYSTRKYPQKMFSVNDMTEINYPFAYISMEEAKEKYSCDTRHILTQVASEESSDEVIDTYLSDDHVLEELHIDMNHAFGREWTALCILGSDYLGNGNSTAESLNASVANEYIREDAYTKYFIPIFTLLIGIISVVGIFDAVRMAAEEQRGNYGILLGMGMTGKRILKYLIVEFLILFVLGTIFGWILGNLCYRGIIICIQELFGVILPSALAVDSYYSPYIGMVTKNPYVWSGCTLFIVTCGGIAGAAVDLLHMTPLGLMDSGIHKRKRSHFEKSLYGILNRYVGRESFVNHVIPYVTVSVVMAVSVFGFLFFHAKAADDTSHLTEKIENARINGVDYYMSQTDDIYIGFRQYMHESGVTPEFYQELEQNDLVKTVKGVVIDYSTALIYDKDEMVSNFLRQQSEYFDSSSDDTRDVILAKANRKGLQYQGVDTDKQEVFHVPTVGINENDMDYFKEFVIAGELHSDKLCSGEEVAVVLTDESLKSCFEVGDSLPLYDFVRPEDVDNSIEWLVGQLPDGHEQDKAAYSVTANGVTEKIWDYDTMKKLSVTIGAVLCIDTEGDDSFYFEDNGGIYTVNIMTGIDAFSKWGLPNKNYTRIGVTLKDITYSEGFESQWMRLLQSAGYMNSIDVYSIIEEKERIQQQVMSIFYAVLGILLVISLLCTSNSIATRIRQMAQEQKVLHLLGMTKYRMLLMYIRRYSFIGLIGAVVSIFPVTVYSFLVRYALKLTTQAYENDMTDVLQVQKPWVYQIPYYDMLNWLCVAVVIVVCIIAVVLLAFLVLTQSGQIEKVLSEKEKSEE